jgi:hypothetical protein
LYNFADKIVSALQATRLSFCHVAACLLYTKFSAQSLLFSSANFKALTLRRSAASCRRDALVGAGLCQVLVSADLDLNEIVVVDTEVSGVLSVAGAVVELALLVQLEES